MKSVSIQYLEAVRSMKKENVSLRRTIHLSFVPDEEIGGIEGMKAFVKSEEFRKLNVGFVLNEGMASVDNAFLLFYGERIRWVMLVHCSGQPDHGSLLVDNTAGEKARRILDKFYEFREKERKKLDYSNLTPGDVTSVNLTTMEEGVQNNVIPPEFTLGIDCRIVMNVDLDRFEETLNEWCKEAGEGVWIEYEQKQLGVPATKIDESNPFWIAFKNVSDDTNLQLKTQIFPGTSDSRYIRELGVPAFSFSPLFNTPMLLHNHNKSVFLRGVEIYRQLITAIANVENKVK